MVRHIVYIAGAGLTKALETSCRVPLMWDFVSVMADYIWNSDGTYDKAILTTLAALEDTGVFEYSSVESKELARRVLDFVNGKAELSDDDAHKFQKLMQTRPEENIERLLNKALEKSANEFGSGFIPQRFNFAINRVFSRIGSNLNTPFLERFLEKQLELADTKHTFVSFNYDLIIESCIEKRSPLAWDVKSGYGFDVERFITPDGALEHMEQFNGAGGHFRLLRSNKLNSLGTSSDLIKILKPHGSLNWLLGFNENYHFMNATPVLCLTLDRSIGYYPSFCCQHIQLKDETGWNLSEKAVWPNASLYLIPAADTKIRDLDVVKRIREQEEEAYRMADEFYVIGWSMPTTDLEQVEIIRECVQKRNKPIERITIINYNADHIYFDRIRDIFGVDLLDLKISNGGFCEYVA